jgi:hypothetical protein
MLVQQSNLFIPGHSIPVMPLTSTLRAAFLAMNTYNVGAVIAADGNLPLYVMGAAFLRSVFRSNFDRHSPTYAATLTLSAAVLTESRGEIHFASDGKDIGLLSIASVALRLTEEIRDVVGSQGRFRLVIDHAAQRAGWLAADEMIANLILTPQPDRTIFTCEQGHKNTDADDGYCSQCPSKLKS